MFRKLAFTLAGLGVAATAFFAAGTGSPVSAEEPPMVPVPYAFCPGAPGDHGPWDRPWLRRSIVESTAEVLNVPVVVVFEGLAHGLSLNQIAFLNGVGSNELQRGILRDEAGDLHRRVHQGLLTRVEAYHIMNWLQAHIDEIVGRHFDCLRDAAAEPAA